MVSDRDVRDVAVNICHCHCRCCRRRCDIYRCCCRRRCDIYRCCFRRRRLRRETSVLTRHQASTRFAVASTNAGGGGAGGSGGGGSRSVIKGSNPESDASREVRRGEEPDQTEGMNISACHLTP